MIVGMETIARQREHRELFVSVDPKENQRAFSLYVRLEYRAMQEKPFTGTVVLHYVRWKLHKGRALNTTYAKSCTTNGLEQQTNNQETNDVRFDAG